jgi:hypothetical protein
MKEPLQIVHPDSGFSPDERELIAAGRQVSMPAEERARVWASIAAAGAAGGGALAAAAAVKATAATSPGTLLAAFASWKGVVVLAVIGGGVAAYQMTRPRTAGAPDRSTPAARHGSPAAVHVPDQPPEPVAPAPAESVPRTQATPAGSGHAAGAHGARPAVASPPGENPTPSPSSRLAEESRAVLAARHALRAGDPVECLRLLDAARASFPDGALAQERAALTILALAKSGQHERARKMAERFLHEHPESPYATDIRQVTP